MKKITRTKRKQNKRKITPLEFALKLEQKGVNVYMKLAAGTENPLGKKLFYSLAVEEIDHAKKVDEIYASMLKNNENKVVADNRNLSSVENEIKYFFESNKEKGIEKGKENISGYKAAIKLERESYNTYKRFHDSSITEVEKLFYKELMEQEKAHLEAVVNVYSYLTNTDDWLQEEESKTWNWMNI